MKRRGIPTREYLQARLRYELGAIYWKHRPLSDFETLRAANAWNALWPGKRAGSEMSNGYRSVTFAGTKLLEHRLIYVMQIGPLSETDDVDHADGNFRNNNFGNLRACSHAQNLMNQSGRRSHLPKGVHWNLREQKFKVKMRANGRMHNIGTYKTLAEAERAATDSRRELHGPFSNDRRSV